ncbi:nucleotide-diphospho-sugar transferase [Calycina marina]|uniref:dolichyl-phosphate beta-glucosyltransferase n=1 Tax=Calycina marina TaxID=1763456 RepID=A0A9P8CGV3_9HELO|nr:nucleotide-diphospho-sugar transferase [Calycina marina]
MTTLLEMAQELLSKIYNTAAETPTQTLLLILNTLLIGLVAFIYLLVHLLAPRPRSPLPSEKQYITTSHAGVESPKPLPCWYDGWNDLHVVGSGKGSPEQISAPVVGMSVVIPAYNEEERLEAMLEEAVALLDTEYGRTPLKQKGKGLGGYEILIVDDGSRDQTVEVALQFARKKGLHDVLRVCSLAKNRGKGGAVTHGFRHVRGAYAVFADADGASRFEDLRKLVEGCRAVEDGAQRGIAVGSRAHMVGTEAVVKRSVLRNALMHSFHLLLRLLTPPATSRIGDTQCGFKLFSRAALPHIIPYMHADGWIFDVEMLMLAESAPPQISSLENGNGIGNEQVTRTSPGIRVAEVAIGWQEVGGSKLNVVWDSLGMAWGLAILRAGWMLGVYKRR